jgi:hypothetical protein
VREKRGLKEEKKEAAIAERRKEEEKEIKNCKPILIFWVVFGFVFFWVSSDLPSNVVQARSRPDDYVLPGFSHNPHAHHTNRRHPQHNAGPSNDPPGALACFGHGFPGPHAGSQVRPRFVPFRDDDACRALRWLKYA